VDTSVAVAVHDDDSGTNVADHDAHTDVYTDAVDAQVAVRGGSDCVAPWFLEGLVLPRH